MIPCPNLYINIWIVLEFCTKLTKCFCYFIIVFKKISSFMFYLIWDEKQFGKFYPPFSRISHYKQWGYSREIHDDITLKFGMVKITYNMDKYKGQKGIFFWMNFQSYFTSWSKHVPALNNVSYWALIFQPHKFFRLEQPYHKKEFTSLRRCLVT